MDEVALFDCILLHHHTKELPTNARHPERDFVPFSNGFLKLASVMSVISIDPVGFAERIRGFDIWPVAYLNACFSAFQWLGPHFESW